MSGPTIATIKRLFAVSGNRCAFPGCPLPLVDLESSTVVGEICHIKAQNPNGPRYDSTQSERERHCFANLLLLCPAHHKVVDQHPETYTVEKLLDIKARHEVRHAGGPEPSDDVVRQLLVQVRMDIHGDVVYGDKIVYREPPPPPPQSPFMVEGIEGFVPRPDEFERLIGHLLDERLQAPVAITTALRGAGGYGKTMLARAICHDERVQRAFMGGILWVTLGQTPDVLGGLLKLYAALTGQRPAFVDVEDAANALAAQLGDGEYLLVVDDVWNHAHLRPFLRGGKHCARLVTTRDSSTLPPNARTVDVDAMQRNEAVDLLGAGLPPADPEAMRALAARLGEWPLLLKLANGALRHHVHDFHQPLSDALVYVHRALDRRGLTAFDARDPLERDQAVARTLGMSLEVLTPEERARYCELGIFPEDTDVPLATLEKLWGTTGGLDELDVEDLCGRLFQLSLLLRFDLADGNIRLHDVMHDYLTGEQADNLRAYHGRLLDAYGVDQWAALPPDEPYLWHYLAYHLCEAGREDELRALMLDFDWLQAKLVATDVNALLADYEFSLSRGRKREPGIADVVRMVRDAIRLSVHVLAWDSTQLASQLLGRLASFQGDDLWALLQRARQWRGSPWLHPLSPSLAPPDGLHGQTLQGHTRGVNAVAVTLDGSKAVSASWDGTVKTWDLEQYAEEWTLAGHVVGVWSVVVTPDGRRAVSTCVDGTLKVWDLGQGAEECTFHGHEFGVNAVAVVPDGKRAVSASLDRTLKVWDLERGAEEHTLQGHLDWVRTVAITPDGRRAISASSDRTLKVWDLERGMEECALVGHTGAVLSVAVTPDGRWAVSTSLDATLKVWDLEQGVEKWTLMGHIGGVYAAAVTTDGKRVVSSSYEGTLKVWNLEGGKEDLTLAGHSRVVWDVAVTADGKRAVSASEDRTLKVWDLEKGRAIATFNGESALWACTIVPGSGCPARRLLIVAGESSGRVHFLRLEGA